jgi:hypothetical protein
METLQDPTKHALEGTRRAIMSDKSMRYIAADLEGKIKLMQSFYSLYSLL